MAHHQSKEEIKEYLSQQFNLPRDQIELMLPDFVAALRLHMENLETALAANDLVLLAKAGHTIKGAFLNLGMEECAAIALQIEVDGKRGGHSTNFRKLIEELQFIVRPCLE
jgi:HPt (histidine-containing phosphotransfer) domain-containing protein